MSRSQLRLMLMSRFPLSLTSILSPLLLQLLLTLLPLLLMLLPQLLLVMPAMPELLPLLMSGTPELLPLLPTDMLLTNLRMLFTACYFYQYRLYKVHLSEWSGVWHQSAKTKSDNEKIF